VFFIYKFRRNKCAGCASNEKKIKYKKGIEMGQVGLDHHVQCLRQKKAQCRQGKKPPCKCGNYHIDIKLDSPNQGNEVSLSGLVGTLGVTEGIVSMSAGLEVGVVGDGAGSLLGLALDVVSDSLSVGLGLMVLLVDLGVGLLCGSVSGHSLVVGGVAELLLGASHSLVVGVGDLVGHVG